MYVSSAHSIACAPSGVSSVTWKCAIVDRRATAAEDRRAPAKDATGAAVTDIFVTADIVSVCYCVE